MDDLPELPFEQVLSYLNLRDRLNSRAVSRSWRKKFDSYPVKSLFYTEDPIQFIHGKRRLISGAFARNIIASTRFTLFFNTFAQSALSNLKYLRLYGCLPRLDKRNREALVQALNSFGQLQELDIFYIGHPQREGIDLELNLPMLDRIHLEEVSEVKKLTLNSPRLRRVKLGRYCPLLNFVHTESVENVIAQSLHFVQVKELKNLKVLYLESLDMKSGLSIDPTFLFSLEQLNEFYTQDSYRLSELFEQKRRYGRTDLKVFFCGLLLNGPDDPAIGSLKEDQFIFGCLAENPSRLADEIPFCNHLYYSPIERVAPELQIKILDRFTDLDAIRVDLPVQDVQRFLNLLQKFDNIVELSFECDQPQDLFDRLPEQCAVQKLSIGVDCPVLDFRFLFRLEHLVDLKVFSPISVESISRVLGEVQFLSEFEFLYNERDFTVQTIGHPAQQFFVSTDRDEEEQQSYAEAVVSDLNAVIQFITENSS